MANPTDEHPNRGPGTIAAAIVAAALILSWGMGRNEQRYQLASAGDAVVRMDTDSGELIACNLKGCNRIEAPDRTKSFGPLKIQIDSDEDKKALPPGNAAN